MNTAASAARSARCGAGRCLTSPALEQLGSGGSCDECDVVVRACVHAVEAHRAIEVADLHRQEKPQLAAALYVVSGFSRTTLMQSDVRQVRHVSRSTMRSSVGDIVEAAKLNWPIGQRCLQKDAPLKTVSMTMARPK